MSNQNGAGEAVMDGEGLAAQEEMALKIVTRIPGTRKGSDKPAYRHSVEVGDLLKAEGYSSVVCIAGILHDIVEDSDTTLEELRELGFSERIIRLVDLCSHENAIEGNDARWVCMMANLVKADDVEAWAIKIADILCNIGDSDTMTAERRIFLRHVKGRLLLSLTKDILGGSELWKRLEREVLI